MTYCAGLLVDTGLVMLSGSRTTRTERINLHGVFSFPIEQSPVTHATLVRTALLHFS
jgi:hypothetical protein